MLDGSHIHIRKAGFRFDAHKCSAPNCLVLQLFVHYLRNLFFYLPVIITGTRNIIEPSHILCWQIWLAWRLVHLVVPNFDHRDGRALREVLVFLSGVLYHHGSSATHTSCSLGFLGVGVPLN